MNPLMVRAQESAAAARILFNGEFYCGASSCAYFAIYNAARALLAEIKTINIKNATAHCKVKRLFSLHFVREGLFDRGFAKRFDRAAKIRISADYCARKISVTEAARLVDSMESFLKNTQLLQGGKHK